VLKEHRLLVLPLVCLLLELLHLLLLVLPLVCLLLELLPEHHRLPHLLLLYLLGILFLQQLQDRLFRLLLTQLLWPTLLHLCLQQIQFYLELDLLLAVAAVIQLKFR
jgi:hypothetical protein